MTRYAAQTSVSVEKSRAEIETILRRYGAKSFISGWAERRAYIGFEMGERRIKFIMPVPDPAEQRFTHSARGIRTVEASHAIWEQACRQSWRALALVIKAKLEAVEAGISVFEDEFLAHIVLPDGRTVAEHTKPMIAAAYESGKVQALLPDFSRP